MRKISILLLSAALMLSSCKKTKVDASSTIAFQSSINDMGSSLSTIKQIKFNEALYILKTFAVDADGNTNELKALAKLLDGKKVPEILSLADQTARANNIDWSSTAPPSLGTLNIFGDVTANEHDANDIKAHHLNFDVIPNTGDTQTASTIVVKPKLLDATDKLVEFSGAALETSIEVLSNGVKLYSAKNLMQDNNFAGFTIRLNNLNAEKVTDHKIDIRVQVTTTSKKHSFSKLGIAINPNSLKQPEKPVIDSLTVENLPVEGSTTPTDVVSKPTTDPKTTVGKFLSNINTQNLKAAYENAQNPTWGSYENFSNPTSGFGSVKSLSLKNINTSASNDANASVTATYDVTDKNGNVSTTKATFGLKLVNGEWKITSYKVNPQ